jgi:hypothetical protein
MTTNRKRTYQVGRRNDKNIPKQQPGMMSRNRWAWCKVYFGQFVIWADYFETEDGAETDEVKDIKLVYPVPNRPVVSWNLTALTTEELDATKELIDHAFALARPYCVARDKEAKDAFAEGDDSHSRIYRSVPQLVYREGAVSEHSKSVQHRSEDADGVSRDGLDLSEPVREPVTDLAERDSSDERSQDDGSEADESEGLRKVGEMGDRSQRVPSPSSWSRRMTSSKLL